MAVPQSPAPPPPDVISPTTGSSRGWRPGVGGVPGPYNTRTLTTFTPPSSPPVYHDSARSEPSARHHYHARL